MVELDHLVEESALVIQVPEAEKLIGAYRWELDPVARLGVPAHITLIYPFIPPSQITADDRARLAALLSTFPVFDFSLTKLDRFPEVLYLAPSPKEKIVELIQNIAAAFPEYPPYAGKFTEINPHLTIAQSQDSALLETIAKELTAKAKQHLPIPKKVEEASLFELHNGLWNKTGTYPLRSNI
jgi:2'-5' RNA ligase